MALRINYNYQADFTHFNLLQTEADMNKALERLATGYRINRAADDAAGLYIADQLKTYAVSLEQATRNAQDGISISQIAQSALTNVYNILNDIKSKAIEAANDSQDDATRQIIQQDINKLVDVIGKIFKDTEFNGVNLFSSGTAVSFTIHYGGRTQQTLLMQSATASAAAATDTNAPSTITLGNTAYVLNVTSQTLAEATISTVDALIKAVDKLNAKFGSYQIELEKIVTNNESQRINVKEAESRIRNVDFAKEMSEFTRDQILMQSGTAMLAQANQLPQLVLQLLR
ncbi:flagellin [Desulfurobacterium pacificum]|uniref:Flagellin n=1 Tax=Desulfurobacterium pacificum TaxID=240166 RepID=A0ABY1NE61_9BACT|nr:flagellin [Desulfurobacterium pacificum]SMP06948.1 flagellin [Desulfurobacterium pacificum]